jgi:hypothetical protein
VPFPWPISGEYDLAADGRLQLERDTTVERLVDEPVIDEHFDACADVERRRGRWITVNCDAV